MANVGFGVIEQLSDKALEIINMRLIVLLLETFMVMFFFIRLVYLKSTMDQ